MSVFLSDEDVRGLLEIDEGLAAVEEGYREKVFEGSINRPRDNLWIGEGRKSLKVLSGTLPSLGLMGLMTYSGGYERRGRTASYVHLLFSAEDGFLKAIIDSKYLSDFRTGATSAVATKYLAKKGAYRLGIFGSGVQDEWQMRAIAGMKKLEEVKVYSPNPSHREAFAEKMRSELGLKIKAVDSPKACLEGVEIVVTATKSREPVFDGSWLEKGAHINAIGAHYPEVREVDSATMKRSLIVVDDREQALEEKGEILLAIKEGAIKDGTALVELGEVVAGKKPGRSDDEQITFFGSGGIAVEYPPLMELLYRKAVEKRVGRELS